MTYFHSPQFGKGKENSASSATGAKKGSALAEKDKNLKTLPKASSALLSRLPLKCNVSQTTSEQTVTHCKETTHAVRNSSVKEQQTKPAVHTNVTVHKQDKTVKKGPASVSSQAQPLHRSSKNAHTIIVKTDLQKRRLVTALEKVAHKSQVRCPTTKEHLTNTVPSCTDPKSLITKQATVTLKTTKETNYFNKSHTDLKKPLTSYAQTKPDRSGKTQTGSQDTRLTNKVGNNPEFTHTQRNVPVTTRQRSSFMSTFSKTENASKSTGASVAGVKAVPRQQRTTFKLPSKPTAQVPVLQTLPRPNKTSSLARGPVQPKTPKSTFNPGTDGIRTVPLDARNKPTTAQEERM